MQNINEQKQSASKYVESLVDRARSALAAMDEQERTEFGTDLSLILALPSPDKEREFVRFALSSERALTPSKRYFYAA